MKTNRFVGLLLAVAMLLSLACPAFAATDIVVSTDKAEYSNGDTMTITTNKDVRIRVYNENGDMTLETATEKTTADGFTYSFRIPEAAESGYAALWTEGEYTVKAGNDTDYAETKFNLTSVNLGKIVNINFLSKTAQVGTRKALVKLKAVAPTENFRNLKDVSVDIEVEKSTNGATQARGSKYTVEFGGKTYSDTIVADGKAFDSQNIYFNFKSGATGKMLVTVTVSYNGQQVVYSQNVTVSTKDSGNKDSGNSSGNIITPPIGSNDCIVVLNDTQFSKYGITGKVTYSSKKLTSDSFVVSVAINGVARNAFVGYDPIKVKVPYTPATGANTANLVVVDANGNVLPRSYYANGYMYVNLHDTASTFYIKELSNAFDDVHHPWAEQAISALSVRKVINGVGDNLYDPDRTVTRAEFTKMLVAMFDIYDESSASTFGDVDANAWYASYIGTAQELGITNGYEDGTFRPNDKVSRQEMSTMLYRAAQALSVSLGNTASQNIFDDDANIQGYAKQAVYDMQKAGILQGIGNNLFDPANSCTRAQATVAVYNMFVNSMTK